MLTVIFVFLGAVPIHRDLVDQLANISAKWNELGIALGVDANTLEGLEHSNVSNQVRLGKVLQSWKDADGSAEALPYTWGSVIKAVGGPIVDNKEKMEEICKHVKKLT